MAGWIDNTNGPIAVLYGAAFGVLRITRLNVKAQAGIVPVDYCVNLVLTCAWNTARECVIKLPPEPPIYNLTPTDDNLIVLCNYCFKFIRKLNQIFLLSCRVASRGKVT